LTGIDILIEVVGNDMDKVEKMLFSSISSEIDMLEEICRHIISSGGKRLRPLILLLTTQVSGYKGENHIPLACVVEFLHTATLLHDDVIDHAEIRRGNSSANKLWGNQATILAGDFFFSKAFSMAVETNNLKALNVIARTSRCMAEAETYQVAKSGDPLITEEEYFFIIKNKTASLISAASKIGGILGGLSERKLKALEDYGLNLGIAFQIMDDILDYSSNEKIFGKTIGKDFQEGSITLPYIAALGKSSPEDRKKMLKIAMTKGQGKNELSKILDLIEKYDGSAYAVKKAGEYSRYAVEALDVFEDNKKKKCLTGLAEYVVERKA
jgi:octaprenyl-diphosphate synthase